MKILLFEWLTGGGLWADRQPADRSQLMVMQGTGMLAEAAIDFLSAGHELQIPVDQRLFDHPELLRLANFDASNRLQITSMPLRDYSEETGFASLAQQLLVLAEDVDAAFVIAPETGGRLCQLTQCLETFNGHFLSPGSELIALTGNKHELSAQLAKHGFQSLPEGLPLADFLNIDRRQWADWIPCVIKPFDGAGSDGVQLFPSLAELEAAIEGYVPSIDQYRIEVFVTGLPVSTAVVRCPSAAIRVLPPMIQQFDASPLGHWIGSRLVTDPSIAGRAIRLVETTLPHLPQWVGYAGFDLVIGDSQQHDYLIEVNPRLTMSYLNYRQQEGFSLASMLMPPSSKSD